MSDVKDVEKMKTSTLLDELDKIYKDSEKDEEGTFDWEKHEEVTDELDKRFSHIWWMTDNDIDSVTDGFNARDEVITKLQNQINELKESLKRHRHDTTKKFTGRAEY